MIKKIQKGSDWGYYDSDTGVTIGFYYQYADDFKEGVAIVGERDLLGLKKYGVLDIAGNHIIPIEYDEVIPDYKEKLFHCKRYVNDSYVPFPYSSDIIIHERSFNGNLLVLNGIELVEVPKKYNEARPFSGGLALVSESFADNIAPFWQTWNWGYIDISGNEIIKCQYDFASDFHEGLARAEILKSKQRENSDSYYSYYEGGFINNKGEIAIKRFYDDAGDFHEGLCWFRAKQLFGFMDMSGKVVIDPIYSSVNDFSEGKAFVSLQSKFEDKLPISKEGNLIWKNEDIKIIIPKKHIWYNDLGIEYLIVYSEIEGRYYAGVIDQKLNEVIPCKYASITLENDKIKAILHEELFYNYHDEVVWYSKSGERLFPIGYNNVSNKYEFDLCLPFIKNTAIVSQDYMWGIIDKRGKMLIDNWFQEIVRLDDGFAISQGLWGKVSMNGDLLKPFKFYSIREMEQGFNDHIESEELDLNSNTREGDNQNDYWERPMSAFENPFYDSDLDLDQQSPEFWDEF